MADPAPRSNGAAAARDGAPAPAAATPAAAAAAARAAAAGPYSDLSQTVTLSNIRQSLVLMEDTIIFGLIERAQFALNAPVYAPGGVPVPSFARADGRQAPLLEWLLRETEAVHGRIRRYTNPDEIAFFPAELPPLALPPLAYPRVLAPAAAGVNVNPAIVAAYVEHLLPRIAPPGDDGNYGSAAVHDVMILQALSRRVHYGRFVAEAKFRAEPERYAALIRARDAAGIMEALTDRAVEARVLERVRLKAATFGRDLSGLPAPAPGEPLCLPASAAAPGEPGGARVDPDAAAALYERWVMPLTKEVEVEYLLLRLEGDPPDL